ncbi:MAG: HEAT repeat domain-containing protein [Planctomycetota bacterium]
MTRLTWTSTLSVLRLSWIALVVVCGSGATTLADEVVVTTTHEVELKNGQVLLGNLSDESDDTTVVLTFGDQGELRLPRSRVEETRPREGKVTVVSKESSPEPKAEEGAELPGAPAEPKPRPKGDASPVTAREKSEAPTKTEGLSAERQAEIADAIRELGRWRTPNRVRAERKLERIGSDAIEALVPVATKHPFDLTRRAAFRLFNQWNDERTLSAAVTALGDKDRFVRESAANLLRDTTGRRFGYRSDASENYRAKRALRWAEYLQTVEAERAAATPPSMP